MLILCCYIPAYMLIASLLMQDVWTELGRPCGIHQKQVLLSHLLKHMSDSFKLIRHVNVDFLSFIGRSNGYSLCVRPSTTDDHMWWLFLQLLYSWFGHLIRWPGIFPSCLCFVVANGLTSSVDDVHNYLCSKKSFFFLWFCRLIKSRNLFCIQTILVMQISIHT